MPKLAGEKVAKDVANLNLFNNKFRRQLNIDLSHAILTASSSLSTFLLECEECIKRQNLYIKVFMQQLAWLWKKVLSNLPSFYFYFSFGPLRDLQSLQSDALYLGGEGGWQWLFLDFPFACLSMTQFCDIMTD